MKKHCAVFIAVVFCSYFFMGGGCRKSVDPGAGSDPADMLPADNDISGFVKKGSPAVMTDYQTIMDAIDGAAEKYIDYGFVEGVQQLYGNGAVNVDVQIFNHGSTENATGIFQELYPPSAETITQGEGLEIIVDHSRLLNYSILYRKGRMFMQINTTEKSDFALNMAKQFCYNIDSKIESAE
ncbi:MAG: hypothetical protein A2268_08285 [Candidatus Raymondbacteria bacterium RifOxyA12_full_50_37]|uniref:DUF4367 domain-containing protein n=1 Tax=Candidatus Raymondbacteria bacterium RIFOXYD12_FULL_49_13 TaxID=1817890 RepID=A0A1F7FF91_UNCRA|nr:MAG: hypothetical protein A2268_08285 [Candidatus Raymondbacteria bacterium RifOxyA12_full_50_37]OGJ92852.1 MAG: hypothetical protein A2248_07075 [Candidatus Raymondbacteria bacterium RIFOXYA2_FULL_49_16]OGJ94121.1 MAG: hypothetical protein A2487_16265 [Candidatus Raymondbacteria bacterium RifOxyC12_full_50_8]OGJ99144.1 MAG: hypothetical protein A2453_09220 [Candidatus Raymondbacteria bacterium RIFOXYC2_FULL_50_21]OGK01610.1 MAG: hypothetical protein A2350_06180 [Candidatus Raymondbacteria b